MITSSVFFRFFPLLLFLMSFPAEDPVYLENEDRRREYVLNDIGKIYIGSHSKPKGRKWIYGQVRILRMMLSCCVDNKMRKTTDCMFHTCEQLVFFIPAFLSMTLTNMCRNVFPTPLPDLLFFLHSLNTLRTFSSSCNKICLSTACSYSW